MLKKSKKSKLNEIMAKKKTARKSKTDSKEVPFEDSFVQLQEIVGELEQGQLSLGDSLKKYELGIQHLRNCYTALDQAEQKIQLLVELDDQGRMVTRNFTGSETHTAKDGQNDEAGDGLF